MKNESQQALLLLRQYLYQQTDEQHPVSVKDILAFLAAARHSGRTQECLHRHRTAADSRDGYRLRQKHPESILRGGEAV